MGAVSHFEIPADDVDRAATFYRQAFGWTVNSMPEMEYTLLYTTPSGETGMPKDPGAINGGLMRRDYGIAHPVITITVDDMEEALTAVEKLGGKTVRGRSDVADMGVSAYVTDTEGNIIGLWQAKQA